MATLIGLLAFRGIQLQMNMNKQILAGITLAALVSTSQAGVTAGSTGLTAWPGSAQIVTMADPNSATVGEAYASGRTTLSQTFKANSSFTAKRRVAIAHARLQL